jgi:hypothetical protein
MGTVENLKLLSKSNFWLVDGTFKIVPILFDQLFSIHGNIDESRQTFPLLYVLLTGKSQKIYDEALKQLKFCACEQNIILDPPIIASDFELASINSMKKAFPQSTLYGCNFHLRKNVYEHIVRAGNYL